MHTLGVEVNLKDEETDRGDGNSMEEGGIVDGKADGVAVPTSTNPEDVKAEVEEAAEEGTEKSIERRCRRGPKHVKSVSERRGTGTNEGYGSMCREN